MTAQIENRNGNIPVDPIGVLIVAHDSQLYGAQRSLLDILSRFDRNRFSPIVLAPYPGPFTEALDVLGIPYFCGWVKRWIFEPRTLTFRELLRRPWRIFRHPYSLAIVSFLSLAPRLLRIARLIHRHRITLVYSNTLTVLDGALVARLCRLPHVWHLREQVAGNQDLTFPFSVNWMPAFILRMSTLVIVNSFALKHEIFGDPSPAKVRVIHNGIDLERYRYALPIPIIHECPQSERIIAICGAVQERKDIQTFVRAAFRLHEIHPDVHFLVIGQGQGAYFQLVKQQAANQGLGRCIHFLGYRSDIPEIFARIDILVSAAKIEPFGRTIIEAMAAGKPVVATRSGGPEEIIEDGVSGFLVDVGDDAAMAVRLAELLSNPHKIKAMGEQARLSVKRSFNLFDSVRRIEAIFDEVLNRPK
jgi:glycosyltransferase involved in cell wall biosynthesis